MLIYVKLFYMNEEINIVFMLIRYAELFDLIILNEKLKTKSTSYYPLFLIL